MKKSNSKHNETVVQSIPFVDTSKQLFFPEFPGSENQFNPALYPNNPFAPCIGVHDWHLRNPANPPWIVDNLLRAGTVNLCDGLGSSGKSILALQLAVSVATGIKWLDFNVSLCGPVLYLNGEDPEDENHRRYLRVLSKLALNQAQMARLQNNLSFISLSDNDIDPAMITAHGETTATYSSLVEIVEAVHPVLVILDPLIFFSNANENDNNLAKQLYKSLRALKKCVLLIHHMSKAAMNGETSQRGKSRGSSVYTENARTRMSLENGILTVDKNNYGRTFEGENAIQLIMDGGVWRPRNMVEKVTLAQAVKRNTKRRKPC